MIENARNTMMGPQATKASELEYHFAGSGEYHPITVTASSPEEAKGKWEKARIPYSTKKAEAPEAEEIIKDETK